jgi:hypothetical protein
MLSRLTTCALILAALATVAYSNAGDEPTCDQSRPVFGARACCEAHKVAGTSAVAVEAARNARLSPLARP